MHQERRTTGLLVGLSMVGCLLCAGGCSQEYQEFYVPLTDPALASGGGGAGGGTTTSTIDPGCIPRGSSEAVRADCGVFVSSSMGSDANDGSQAKPFATIATAIAAAQSEPIYLCAEVFPESVHLTSGVKIFGGLDCANEWKLVGDTTKSEISPAAGEVPLVLSTGVKATLVDLALNAKDAVVDGASSIAVIASNDADLDLSHCDVAAGVAMNGAPGAAFAMNASAGGIGNGGADACTAASVEGGNSTKNACDAADLNDESIGGKGGSSDEFTGGTGSPGLPDGAPNGGAGEGGMACTAGTVGNDGAAGVAASGATGVGSITGQGYCGAGGQRGRERQARPRWRRRWRRQGWNSREPMHRRSGEDGRRERRFRRLRRMRRPWRQRRASGGRVDRHRLARSEAHLRRRQRHSEGRR